MAELEELEQEELNKKMTNVRLPNVPSTSLPAQPDRRPGRRPGMTASAQRSRPGVSTSLVRPPHRLRSRGCPDDSQPCPF